METPPAHAHENWARYGMYLFWLGLALIVPFMLAEHVITARLNKPLPHFLQVAQHHCFWLGCPMAVIGFIAGVAGAKLDHRHSAIFEDAADEIDGN